MYVQQAFPWDIFKLFTFSIFYASFGVKLDFIDQIRQNYTDLRCLLNKFWVQVP